MNILITGICGNKSGEHKNSLYFDCQKVVRVSVVYHTIISTYKIQCMFTCIGIFYAIFG